LVHHNVVVALDPSVSKQLRVKPQQRRLIEPLEAFGTNMGMTYDRA
jgi:hypothetical protein